jgi:hypothetical protein
MGVDRAVEDRGGVWSVYSRAGRRAVVLFDVPLNEVLYQRLTNGMT